MYTNIKYQTILRNLSLKNSRSMTRCKKAALLKISKICVVIETKAMHLSKEKRR